MPNTVKRLNYYDHQFLRQADFTDEQTYHVEMRRQHNQWLHTWGIAHGLEVILGSGTAVTVNAGFAIDSLGQEMVLPANTNLELGGEKAGTTLYITIAYGEQQSDATTESGGPGNTRVTEMPKLSFSKDPPADKSMTLILAGVPRTDTGLGAVDTSDRKQAGVVLGDQIELKTLTLKKDGVAPANWAVLSCGGVNNAGLLVTGTLSIAPAIAGGPAVLAAVQPSDLQIQANNAIRLVVQASTGNVGIGTATPASQLHIRKDVPGKLGPSLTLMNGGGGAGAAASIDLSGYDPGAQAPALRIQAIDDGQASAHLSFSAKQPGPNTNSLVETMRLTSAGSIGLGLPNPDRNLTIFRTGTATGVYANVKNSSHEILVGVDSAAVVSAMTASDLQLRTNNTNRVVVQANSGNVGIGPNVGVGPVPASKLDIAAAARTGTHGSGLALYVTGDMGEGSGGLEVRHSNGTQGVGLGYNTIYATGTLADQDLTISSRGAGKLVFKGTKLEFNGTISSSKWRATQVINQKQGPLPIDGTFTSGGGTLVIIFSGSAWASTGNRLGLLVSLDGTQVGSSQVSTNELTSHKSFPANILVIPNIAAATTHKITLSAAANTTTDSWDFFNVAVLELPF